MSEERLQKIKGSVEFQKEMLKAHNMTALSLDEEEELIEEIERLNNIINKAREYIKLVATDHDIMNNNEIIYTQMQYEEIENLLEILGSDKE